MVPGRGLRGGNDGREVHSACGSGFLASAARAARLCQDMAGILLDASLLRDARAPFRSAPRLARRFYCPMAFLGLSAYEDARALGRRRRVSWGLDYHFNGLSRTNLVQTPALS